MSYAACNLIEPSNLLSGVAIHRCCPSRPQRAEPQKKTSAAAAATTTVASTRIECKLSKREKETGKEEEEEEKKLETLICLQIFATTYVK